jgi:hypothetical protein
VVGETSFGDLVSLPRRVGRDDSRRIAAVDE